MATPISPQKCPAPFLNAADFPYTAGYNASRLCSTTLGLTCCLPCPLTDWVYPDDFNILSAVAQWISVFSLACCAFLLLSFLVLPVQRTSRHYLTICLVLAVALLMASQVVPLGAKPNQCHDRITPNDMHSDLACAFSGSLILFGGFASIMWIFIRSLSLYLQICWQIVPGRKFFLASLTGGWGVPALSLGLSLGFSGISYRFSNTCAINHESSLGTFWIPFMVFTGLAAILQFITFGYCIRVYLQNLMDHNITSAASSNLPSHQGSSIRTATARATYRRIRKVVALQWRGVMVVILMIVAVVDFSVVFMKLDAMQQQKKANPAEAKQWLACLFTNKGDKNKCLGLTGSVILNEPTILSVLFMVSLLGFWCLLFLGRLSMAGGWLDLLRRPFLSREHFVSVDARRLSVTDPRNYEMLASPPQPFVASPDAKSPDPRFISFTKEVAASPQSGASDYFTPTMATDATFRERKHSFSQPRPPSRAASKSSHRVTFSREGPAGSPPLSKDWSSFPEEDDLLPATITTVTASAPGQRSPPPQQRSPPPQQPLPPQPSSRSGSALHGTGAWERSPSALSGGSRAGSALGRERTDAPLGREWPSPAQRAGGVSPSQALGRSNSALGRDYDWDYRATYARGGVDSGGRNGWS